MDKQHQNNYDNNEQIASHSALSQRTGNDTNKFNNNKDVADNSN